MEFRIEDIKLDELNLTGSGYTVNYLLMKNDMLEQLSDETYSWALNPPPIYASADKSLKDRVKEEAREYAAKREESVRITRLVKKEFYDFLCTESEYYHKERSTIRENVNLFITGVSGSIATKLVSIEIGIITSLVTCFVIALCKVGKKVVCDYSKTNE